MKIVEVEKRGPQHYSVYIENPTFVWVFWPQLYAVHSRKYSKKEDRLITEEGGRVIGDRPITDRTRIERYLCE